MAAPDHITHRLPLLFQQCFQGTFDGGGYVPNGKLMGPTNKNKQTTTGK